MKSILLFITLFTVGVIKAQTPDAALLLKLNEASTSDLDNINGAESGMLAYDSTLQTIKVHNGTNWVTTGEKTSGTIILNRNGGNGILPTATNTYFDMPINASHIQANEGGLFTVIGTGEIRIAQDGLYALSASLSTSNMPAGNTKYILAARRNGTLIGYLSRGFVTLPSRDFWGSSGTISYALSAGDVINFQYVLNAGGASLNAVFTNASITKL